MKQVFLFFLIILFNFSFAQKKELRKAQKLYDSGDLAGSEQILNEFESILENIDDKFKPNYKLLKGKVAKDNKNFTAAFDILMPLKGIKSIEEDLEQTLALLAADIVNSAIDDNNKGDFKSSAKKLYLAYEVDKEQNIDYLYYAASSAVNAEELEKSLSYYKQLKDINYTGIVTKYYVTEVDSENEIEVTQSEYDIYKKSKSYKDFREEKTESKFPEIVKNIALIYAQLGDDDKAMLAVQEARQTNPNDINLILTEANIYIQLGEKVKFQELMNEAISQDPNNPGLFYNLAVVTSDLGDKKSARQYYERAIEIDPNYQNAYLNLVALILEGEQQIVEEMNSLGTSRKDNARYDALKLEREALYRECVPILKKLIEIEKDNDAIKTLMNIYGTLGDNEGFKEMKALLSE
ncbi:MAG: tetratricopeptide repeat protein [Bacteroidota bacterium]|nr:tetratricopeptide repeat protein [Bacteroidota bacterium]